VTRRPAVTLHAVIAAFAALQASQWWPHWTAVAAGVISAVCLVLAVAYLEPDQ
jgi:hypothetical protein